MLAKDTQVFVSFHSDDKSNVLPILDQIRAAGWNNIVNQEMQANRAAITESIQQSGMILLFLSKAYAMDSRLMLEEFAYAATVARKSFVPVWLDNLADIQQDYQKAECDQQLLSTLEMLTAKHTGITADGLVAMLEQFMPDSTLYTPSTPQICEKPCEAYEGSESYIFISYAHDDAPKVYPIIKDLYESGWDLWYDEGIKITERYLPVIAHHVKCCSVLVLMLTNRCLERPFVMDYELEYARQCRIPIIPLLLDDLNSLSSSPTVNIAWFMEEAISLESLVDHVSGYQLPNQGTRQAIPPAIKQNVVYDVTMALELPGFEYAIQDDKTSVVITKYTGNDTDIVIPSTITRPDGEIMFRVIGVGKNAFQAQRLLVCVVIPDSVTSIGDYAFYGCTSLASIVIPDGVRSIGNHAFGDCESLTSIAIPDSTTSIGNSIFYNCHKLDTVFSISRTTIYHIHEQTTSYSIPNSVASIGDCAFEYCTSLVSIVIPDSVTSIGKRSFSGCESLVTIAIPDSITNIGSEAFYGCKRLASIVIPNSVTSIGKRSFYGCESLVTIAIPDSITNIDSGAFYGCKRLASIVIPDSVTNIGDSAFSMCNSLASIAISANATSIGDSVFYGCERLASIVIPDSITSINEEAFLGCESLASIAIPDSVISIGVRAFYNCKRLASIAIPDGVTSIGGSAFDGCKSLASIAIPNSITNIGGGVFHGCESLASIAIPDSVMSIGSGAFLGCKRLVSIAIPDSVTNIGGRAFYGCESLASIAIPDSVTSIGKEAFKDCKLLASIAISDKVTSIGDSIFLNCTSLTSITEGECTYYLKENLSSCLSSKNDYKERLTFWQRQISREILSQNKIDTLLKEINTETAKVAEDVRPTFNRIPQSQETPRVLICCADDDVQHISLLLTELYWEGFNFIYEKTANQQAIEESQGVLAFFSGHTLKSEQTINILKEAIKHDASRIIQVFLENCDWPDEVRNKLHDRQAILKNYCSEREFMGKIRDSLRQFGCNIGTPRGFDIKKTGNSVEIVKFHPTDFQHVIIPKTFFNPPLPVTSIGDYAFSYSKLLAGIVIPDSITNIGTRAFYGCESLTNINIPNSITILGDYAFSHCKLLTGIVIPDSITSIGTSVFFLCESLTNINIPNSVTSIGEWAFQDCKSLTNFSIPNSIAHIGNGVFSGCKSLTNITIPDNITTIGDYAFSNCELLVDIVIPNSIKDIGKLAFQNCKSLTNITIPDGVTSISDSVFSKCKLLGRIAIPDSVTSIGDSAFSSCKSLASISIPNSVTSIGKGAFVGCESLASIAIPDGVTSIGDSAFVDCESLASIDIPNGITNIGDSTFLGCKRLVSITIPDSVTSIGDLAFGCCESLTSIVILDTVTSIGNTAFASDYSYIGNESLTNITIYTTPESVAWRYAIKHKIKHKPLNEYNKKGALTPAEIDALLAGVDSTANTTIPKKGGKTKGVEVLTEDEINQLLCAINVGDEDTELKYKKALENNEQLASENPAAFEPDLATSCNTLADFYKKGMRYKEAEPLYKKAVVIREKLLAEYPGEAIHERAFAIQLYQFGLLCSATGRISEAEAAFTRALSFQEPLALANPGEYGAETEKTCMELRKLRGEN